MSVFLFLIFIFWIILNGGFSFEIITIGFIVTTLIGVFIIKTSKLNSILRNITFKKIIYIFEYLIILLIEIIKANIDMIRIVLSPSTKELRPALYGTKINLKSTLARVALANSITLTPGTITVSINKDKFLIHAIDKSNLEGIDKSIFVEKLSRMED